MPIDRLSSPVSTPSLGPAGPAAPSALTTDSHRPGEAPPADDGLERAGIATSLEQVLAGSFGASLPTSGTGSPVGPGMPALSSSAAGALAIGGGAPTGVGAEFHTPDTSIPGGSLAAASGGAESEQNDLDVFEPVGSSDGSSADDAMASGAPVPVWDADGNMTIVTPTVLEPVSVETEAPSSGSSGGSGSASYTAGPDGGDGGTVTADDVLDRFGSDPRIRTTGWTDGTEAPAEQELPGNLVSDPATPTTDPTGPTPVGPPIHTDRDPVEPEP